MQVQSDASRPRIVLYSHDTMGLGHVRRNLLIAQALSKSRLEPNVLLICGAIEGQRFPLPAGVDCTILPALYKERDGQYRSRRLHMQLDEIVSLRREILVRTIAAFDPDIFVVDGVPWGAVGELNSTLEYLSVRGRTRCVLGMRDVWDEPAVISKEWRQRRNWDAIRAYYDQIWIYGSATVYDPAQEYRLEHDIADKIRYTGYLHQRARLDYVSRKDYAHFEDGLKLPDSPFILCLLGGGQDGLRLAETFVDSELPANSHGIILTGPHMDPEDREDLHAHAESKRKISVVDFVPEPTVLLQKADCVVSMGGYNTVCEIMSFGKRALVVPRVLPRKEQLIRAERLQRLGILDVLHPDDLDADAVTRFIQCNMGKPPPSVQIDMNGLTRVPRLAESLLAETEIAEQAMQLTPIG